MVHILMHLVNLPTIHSNKVQNMNNCLFPSKLTTELKQTLLPHHHQILNKNFLQLKISYVILRLGLSLVGFFPFFFFNDNQVFVIVLQTISNANGESGKKNKVH